jgi:hypothetical protein
LLIVKHSFAETGPGSAAQLAGYWEVFSPGPLTGGHFLFYYLLRTTRVVLAR